MMEWLVSSQTLTNQHVKPLDVMENPYTGDATVAVEVANKDLVFRYTSMRIENVTKKSAQWKCRFVCSTVVQEQSICLQT